jgi:hypothetical protein
MFEEAVFDWITPNSGRKNRGKELESSDFFPQNWGKFPEGERLQVSLQPGFSGPE